MTGAVTDTLGNLQPDHHIWCRCPRCDRNFEASIPALVNRLGPGCQVTTAMRKISCAICGGKAETWRGHGINPRPSTANPER